MEPAADAALTDGAWRWTPEAPPLGRLVLANSPFAGDYRLCWSGGCRPLADLAPPHPSAPIELYPCAGGAGAEHSLDAGDGGAAPLASNLPGGVQKAGVPGPATPECEWH